MFDFNIFFYFNSSQVSRISHKDTQGWSLFRTGSRETASLTLWVAVSRYMHLKYTDHRIAY